MASLALCGCTSAVHPQAEDICDVGQLEILNSSEFRSRIASSSGLNPGLRRQLWPPLLGLTSWSAVRTDDGDVDLQLEVVYMAAVDRAELVDPRLVTTIDAVLVLPANSSPRAEPPSARAACGHHRNVAPLFESHPALQDVPRTDPGLSAESMKTLRTLLLAHCVLEPVWGYFQGMNDGITSGAREGRGLLALQ